MSPGYVPFHPNPSKPKFKPPLGAVDAHCHVFGPESEFPYAPERKYTPCDAPKEKLFALRDFLGFDKNVIVQASCHGKDNRAMVDALETANGRAKGVAFVGEEVTDAELRWMDQAGVRGVRFNFLKRLVDFTPRDVLQRIAARIEKLGWHIVVYFEMPDLAELEDFFTALPTAVVVDHMGRPDVTKGVEHPDNRRFHKLMDKHKNFWVKATCPERMAAQARGIERPRRLFSASAAGRVVQGLHPHAGAGGRASGAIFHSDPHCRQPGPLPGRDRPRARHRARQACAHVA